MKNVKAHPVISSFAVVLVGVIAMVIGGIMGGDFLDGIAGGTTENTHLETGLLYGGLVVALMGFFSFTIAAVFAFVPKKTNKK